MNGFARQRWKVRWLIGAALFFPVMLHAESIREPAIFVGNVGPLSVRAYQHRTMVGWRTGNPASGYGFSYFVIDVPFYALVAGAIAGPMIVGVLVYLRRRTCLMSLSK